MGYPRSAHTATHIAAATRRLVERLGTSILSILGACASQAWQLDEIDAHVPSIGQLSMSLPMAAL
ncbi:MAG TPA: hypothetical protein VEI29_02965 [Burkholderiaceae bacterium]|nr:hypothetical protein [Burkholderiaceae bacterium]